MPRGPRSAQRLGKGHYHFVTCACYGRQTKLAEARHRDLFLQLLEEVRAKFRFSVAGYCVMPDHFQLLITDPEIDTAAHSVETLQQRYQRRYNNSVRETEPVWATPCSDLHVWTPEGIAGRLRLVHEAPVRAGLVETATDWDWSSARDYAGGMCGVVTVTLAAAPGTLLSQTS